MKFLLMKNLACVQQNDIYGCPRMAESGSYTILILHLSNLLGPKARQLKLDQTPSLNTCHDKPERRRNRSDPIGIGQMTVWLRCLRNCDLSTSRLFTRANTQHNEHVIITSKASFDVIMTFSIRFVFAGTNTYNASRKICACFFFTVFFITILI